MNLNKNQRAALRLKFGGRCAYCGVELPVSGWHADHVEPVGRKMKWTQNGGYKATGDVYCPERDTEDNLYPACAACNIDKGSYSLEGWRKELERITGILHRGYPTYRHAVRFGQVIEQPGPIVFWFEQWEQERSTNNV